MPVVPSAAAPVRRPPAWWRALGLVGLLQLTCAALTHAVAGNAPEGSDPVRTRVETQSRSQTGTQTEAQIQAERRACLICHRMATIAYRDPQSGEIRDLHVDAERFARSNHGALACTHCHERDYRKYPHAHGSADENLRCVGCHADDPKLARYRFKEIEAEFGRSVHVREDPGRRDGRGPSKALTCFSCHDPHGLRAAQRGEPIPEIVRSHNLVCMSCHRDLADPVTAGHRWLPNREAHWRAVRCLDCHTPLAALPSHEILPAGQGVRSCDDCHSRDSILLNQLYAYRSLQTIATRGLLSLAVFNDAYVVGMSRNDTLDRVALGLIGLTVLGIGAHAIGRYRAYKRYGRSR